MVAERCCEWHGRTQRAALLGQDIGRGLTAATGHPVANAGGALVALANQLCVGKRRPDIFMGADAEVNDRVVMGPANGNIVRWYFNLARQPMVAYTPSSLGRAVDAAGRSYPGLHRPGEACSKLLTAWGSAGYLDNAGR